MMRTTPCRLMTLQCSQIGFTLERTFTRISGPGLGLAGQYRRGPKETQVKVSAAPSHCRTASTNHPELDQAPPGLVQPIAQQEHLNPDVLGARHPVLPLQLD